MLSTGVLLSESMFMGKKTNMWSRPSCGMDRAPTKDALAITPQAPAAHIFLSRLPATCDRITTIKCQFGYTRSSL